MQRQLTPGNTRIFGSIGRFGPRTGDTESEDVYGWLVGSWELTVCHYLGMDVTSRPIRERFTLVGFCKDARFKMFGFTRQIRHPRDWTK
jgi:hypothetical protein